MLFLLTFLDCINLPLGLISKSTTTTNVNNMELISISGFLVKQTFNVPNANEIVNGIEDYL